MPRLTFEFLGRAETTLRIAARDLLWQVFNSLPPLPQGENPSNLALITRHRVRNWAILNKAVFFSRRQRKMLGGIGIQNRDSTGLEG